MAEVSDNTPKEEEDKRADGIGDESSDDTNVIILREVFL